MKEKKLIWSRLKDMSCPKCAGLVKLDPDTQMYKCTHDIGHKPCDFKISKEAFNRVVTNLYNPNFRGVIDEVEENLSELSEV